eukprot:scaffold32901_cov118-Isochrysis_galbana.AAC.4
MYENERTSSALQVYPAALDQTKSAATNQPIKIKRCRGVAGWRARVAGSGGSRHSTGTGTAG